MPVGEDKGELVGAAVVAAGVRLELTKLVPSLLAEGQVEGEDEAEAVTLALRM